MRDSLPGRRPNGVRRIRMALGGLALLLIGCSTAGEPETWRGQQHSGAEPACALIESPEQWEAAWAQVGQTPPKEWPGGEAVGVLFLDKPRPSGGYRPELAGVTDGEAKIRVVPPDGPATTVISHPWLIALCPRGGVSVVDCAGG